MTDERDEAKPNRRHALECMIWAGTGIIWTISGGVPKSLNLLDEAQAARRPVLKQIFAEDEEGAT